MASVSLSMCVCARACAGPEVLRAQCCEGEGRGGGAAVPRQQ
jgi:hypothetical protein